MDLSPYEIKQDFTHLHVHTKFSVRDGLPDPKKIVDRAKKLGFEALAITDHGNMGGHYQFAVQANATKMLDGEPTNPIKPIFGIEAYLCEDIYKKEHMVRSDNMGNKRTRRPKHYHILLLAKNEIGYDNLKIMSHVSSEVGFYYEPRIDWDLLSKHKEGLICCSACLGGEIASSILTDQDIQITKNIIDKYKQLFQDDFYLEVQWHQMEEEKKAYSKIIELSDEFKIPLVATNDVHYILDTDSVIHDQIVAMKFQRDEEKGGSSDTRNLSSAYKNPEFFLKSTNEMVKSFDDRLDAVYNTREIVEKCEFKYPLNHAIIWPECKIDISESLTKWRNKNFPELSIKQAFLLQKSMDGLKDLGLSNNKDYVDRLKYEWGVVFDMGYEEYFIAQAKIMEECRNRNITTGPGRGCLTGDALVLTKNGYKELKEIKKGDLVYSHTGNLRKVLKTMEYNIDESILEIKTSNSFGTIKMTNDHKVYGIKRSLTNNYLNITYQNKVKKYNDILNQPQWYPISEMSVGDLLFTPYLKNKKYYMPEEIDLSKYINDEKVYIVSKNKISLLNPLTKNIKSNFNRKIEFDAEFAYLLGRWIGDGWFVYNEDKRKYGIGIAFNTDDITSIERISNYLESIGLTISKRFAKNKKLLQLMVYNKLFAKLFIDLFPKYKSSSCTKYIGDFKYMEKDLLKSLINGIIGSDGYIEQVGSYSRENIDTTSLTLAYDIRESLLLLSIPSYISVRPSWVDKNGYCCKTSYKIRFIGVNTTRKNNNIIFENGYYVKIKEILPHYNDKVYDVCVDTDNSYLTQNFTVHNSGAGSLALYTLGVTKVDPLKLGLIFERFLNPGRGVGFDHHLPIMKEDKESLVPEITKEIIEKPALIEI